MEKEKPYTREEIAKMEESRILSDAELVKGGGKIEVDEKGNKTNLLLTQEQIGDAAEEAPKTPDGEVSLLQKRKELEILESESKAMQDKYNSEEDPNVKRELQKQRDEIIDKIQKKHNEIKRILPMMIVYRENDLFDKYIPQIKQILSDLKGREVNTQSFPREADSKEIEGWYKEHQNEFKDLLIISDHTAGVPWTSDLEEELESNGVLNDKILDEILNEASDRAMLGNEKYEEIYVSDDEFSEKESQALITRVAERIFENKENIPDKVYIFLDNILDHSFVDFEVIDELMFNPDSNSEISDDERKERRRIRESEAEKIKECLIQAGLEPSKIIISQEFVVSIGEGKEIGDRGVHFRDYRHVPAQGGKEVFMEADRPNNWVIIDRHAGQYKDFFGDFKNAIKLNLPSGNFFGDARDKGLIPEIKPEVFLDALKKTLKKRFGTS